MSSEKTNLPIIKVLAVVIAVLCAVFDLAIVGLHLVGRLVGMSKIGVIGTIGVGIVAIACAWIACDKKSSRGLIATAIIGEVLLTTVSLVNAGIAMDLEWQDAAADKAIERKLILEKARNEEARKTSESQAQSLAAILDKDKTAGRNIAKNQTLKPDVIAPVTAAEEKLIEPVDITKLGFWPRYGMTIVPLILSVLVTVALAITAGGRDETLKSETVESETEWKEPKDKRIVQPTPQAAFKSGKESRR